MIHGPSMDWSEVIKLRLRLHTSTKIFPVSTGIEYFMRAFLGYLLMRRCFQALVAARVLRWPSYLVMLYKVDLMEN